MKRIGLTLFVYIAALAIIWLSGWLWVADWYSTKYGKSYLPILNFSALAALITAIVCILVERLLFYLNLHTMMLVIDFAIRIMLMLVLSIVMYFAFIAENADRFHQIAYVMTVFVFYNAVLVAHVASSILCYQIDEKLKKNELL